MKNPQMTYRSLLLIEIEQLRHEADIVPRGRARDGLLRHAEKLEVWVNIQPAQTPPQTQGTEVRSE